MPREYSVIDAHVGGAGIRLLTSGLPTPRGDTWEKRQAWLERHADEVRLAITRPPRGARDLTVVALTEPLTSSADAGLVFMNGDGYPALSGSAVMAATTIALERGLITKPISAEDPSMLRLEFDTPAGIISASAQFDRAGETAHVAEVAITTLPAAVVAAGLELGLGSRRLKLDLVAAGTFVAIVDGESVGIPLDVEHLPELRRTGQQIAEDLRRHPSFVHPTSPQQHPAVLFTGPPINPDAHLRSVTILRGGACHRSPGVTGTSALMAVLSAMGLLREEEDFVHEGLLGLTHRGFVQRQIERGGVPAIESIVTGTTWITGEQRLLVDDRDPLKCGIGSDRR